MKITANQRELTERALDELFDAMMEGEQLRGDQLLRATRLYTQAAAIYRERPDGARKVRDDFGSKRRTTPQGEMQV